MSIKFDKAVDLAISARQRQSAADRYYDDPVAWAQDVAGMVLWSRQREIARSVIDNKNVAVKAGHGVGKALSLDTPVATTLGWKTVGTLTVGDHVFDEQGQPTRVVAKSEIFNMPMYEVGFSDGATLRTNAPHEWLTIDHREAKKVRRNGPVADWRDHWGVSTVKETAVIQDTLNYVNVKNKRAANHIIPNARALNLPDAVLPIDPYVLGAWLGDGTSNAAAMTIGSDGEFIIEEFAKVGYQLTKTRSGPCRYTFARQGFLQLAHGADLVRNKHIPSDYQRASIAQRKELLRGLMDTDGFVCHGNLCGIDLMNAELAYDTVELIRGLGVRASITPSRTYLNGRDVGTRYRIVFNPDFSPFTTGQYKDKAYHAGSALTQTSRRTMRTVSYVREIPTVPSQCIQVDSPRHLFLAGEHLIPTHNSLLMAVLICWWVDTRYPNVFVATTAPSQAQVGAILWREVRKIKARITKRHEEFQRKERRGEDTAGLPDHELPGYITAQNEWKLDGGLVLGFGRKPPDNKEDDSFQGLHDGAVLAIGDEACGLTEEMIDALGNITSNQNSRRVLIANPTNPSSHFGKIFRAATGAWEFHTISVLDSPNFTDEKNELPKDVLEKLTGPDYVEDKKKEYGEDSPRYKARVLGEFAYDLGDTLIKPEDLAIAHDVEIVPDPESPVILGVDVARFGDDLSTIYSFRDGQLRFVDKDDQGHRVTATAAWVHKYAIDLNASEVRVDSLGIGGGVVDNLIAFDPPYAVVSMNGNGATPDRKQWHNARAYWWDEFRRNVRLGRIDIDVADETLADELQSVGYKFSNTSGGLLIESKEDMKKRGMKSPDFADAAVYACADAEFIHTGLPPAKQVFYQDPSDIIGEEPDYLRLMIS